MQVNTATWASKRKNSFGEHCIPNRNLIPPLNVRASAVGFFAMADPCNFNGVIAFQIEEHAVFAAAETESLERGFQLFHITDTAG